MLDPRYVAESPEAVGLDPRKVEALLERAAVEVIEGALPSSQIAIARHGRIAAMRTVGGVKHGGRSALANDQTLYLAFSCTKAITSAAAWLVVQDGKLSVDERVADIIPEFGANGKDAIVVEQLMTHMAGFPMARFDPADFPDRVKRVATFASWELEWEPGSRVQYHPLSSMYVLAEIIERRTGDRFSDFIRQRICRPLGLESLYLGLPADLHARLADVEFVGKPIDRTSDSHGIRIPKTFPEDVATQYNRTDYREAGIPAGGAACTAAELALFYQALLNDGRALEGPRVFRPETLRAGLAIRSGALLDPIVGKRANRTLGLVVAGDDDRIFRGFARTNSPAAFGHSGAGGQVSWGDPATGISLGYLTNGHERNEVRSGARGLALSTLAADCLLA